MFNTDWNVVININMRTNIMNDRFFKINNVSLYLRKLLQKPIKNLHLTRITLHLLPDYLPIKSVYNKYRVHQNNLIETKLHNPF